MVLKLQIWSMDLIFAVVIFSFTLAILGVAWLHISNGLSTTYSNSDTTAYLQASTMSDVLLSTGTPADWQNVVNTANIPTWRGIAPGLEISAGQPEISTAKLYALMSMASYNYTATKSLFGIGNNYYIVITSPGPGLANITIGQNPLAENASTILLSRRAAVLNGNPVWVDVELWSNGTASAG